MNTPSLTDSLWIIYPVKLEINETTERRNSSSFLDIFLSYGTIGNLNTSPYDKYDGFSINNFQVFNSYIPSSLDYISKRKYALQ